MIIPLSASESSTEDEMVMRLGASSGLHWYGSGPSAEKGLFVIKTDTSTQAFLNPLGLEVIQMGSLDGFLGTVGDFQPDALILGVPKLYLPHIGGRDFSMQFGMSSGIPIIAARIIPFRVRAEA